MGEQNERKRKSAKRPTGRRVPGLETELYLQPLPFWEITTFQARRKKNSFQAIGLGKLFIQEPQSG